MQKVTCPHCNVDVDPQELKRNGLCCPTCGYDFTDATEDEDKE
jgi:hypothetical protein